MKWDERMKVLESTGAFLKFTNPTSQSNQSSTTKKPTSANAKAKKAKIVSSRFGGKGSSNAD